MSKKSRSQSRDYGIKSRKIQMTREITLLKVFFNISENVASSKSRKY